MNTCESTMKHNEAHLFRQDPRWLAAQRRSVHVVQQSPSVGSTASSGSNSACITQSSGSMVHHHRAKKAVLYEVEKISKSLHILKGLTLKNTSLK